MAGLQRGTMANPDEGDVAKGDTRVARSMTAFCHSPFQFKKRYAVGLFAAIEGRVERVTQPITDDVEAQHRNHDQQPRKNHQMSARFEK